jgi:transposase
MYSRGRDAMASMIGELAVGLNSIGALFSTKLLTVSLFEQNINTAIFNSWVSQDLIPKLPIGSIIVMDNAAFHKGKSMQ